MSQSPTTIGQLQLRPDNPFMVNQRRLYELIHQGKSFSGRERNCCFWNLGHGQYANQSALSGFDFDDDGRAVALVDWDRDGDLDCLVSNRTGPRLRMMINQGADRIPQEERNYLALRLEGTKSNRNAVGARVQVYLAGEAIPLQRTVYAGSGYLAQSSRWLHFGLGKAAEIDRIVIRWPSGAQQTVSGLRPNQHYVVKEEESTRALSVSGVSLPLDQAELPPASSSAMPGLRVCFTVPVPMPNFRWQRRDGGGDEVQDSTASAPGPILLNLWSTQCRPCLEELKEWGDMQRSKKLDGVRIVGLNVDAVLSESAPEMAERAREAFDRLQPPGELGFATPEVIDQLQIVCDVLLARKRPMPVPTSFLLGKNGDLLVIYQGKIQGEQLMQDLMLEGEEDQVNPRAQLFPGRWLLEPRLDPVLLLAKLLEKDHLEMVENFFTQHDQRLVKSDRYAIVKGQLGTKYVLANRFADAERAFRDSLRIKPDNGIVLNDLGGVLRKNGKIPDAVVLFQEAAKLEPSNPIIHINLGATLFAAGDLEAGLNELRTAVKIDPDALPAHQLLGDTLRRIGRTSEAVPHFEAMARLQPASLEAWMNLGAILLSSQDVDRGIACLQKAAAIDAKHAGVEKNLGLAYLLKKDYRKAQDHFNASLKIQSDDPAVHFNLGVLLVQEKQIGEAIEHLRAANRLRPDDPKYRAALKSVEGMKPEGQGNP